MYNSTGTIDQQALDTLGYWGLGAGSAVSALSWYWHNDGTAAPRRVVTALTERVRVRAGDSGDAAAADFVRFFPGFIWAVRDFVLELSVDGRRVNEDEYLEHVLRLRTGTAAVVPQG